MALSLVTPVGSNFLKDWPTQNAANCDAFDAAAGACLITHPLKTYTPVWTSSGTQPSFGTGAVQIGYYYLVFDTVFVYVEMKFGTGSSRGSGTYIISLPFSAKTNIFRTGVNVIGNGQVYSNLTATARQPVVVILNTISTVRFALKMGGATSRIVGEGVPILFADGDGLMFCARYQRDTS
jgi:hypothetical protein